MLSRRKVEMPETSLSILQRIWLYELGDIEGALEGNPWLWPIRVEAIPPIKRPIVDEELCNQCGLCIDFCPQGVIFKTEKAVEIDYTYCKGCMICVVECKRGAVKIAEGG